MLAGELYSAHDGELKAAHARAIKLCEKLNYGNLSDEEREEVTKQLLGKCGKNTVLGRGFWCDYGSNIEVGDNFYVNYDVVILDVCRVKKANETSSKSAKTQGCGSKSRSGGAKNCK